MKSKTSAADNLAKLTERRRELQSEVDRTEADLLALGDSMSERLLTGESIDVLTVEEGGMRLRLDALTNALELARLREADLKKRIHEIEAERAIKDGRSLFNKSRAKIDAARPHVDALAALGADLADDCKMLNAHSQTIYKPGSSAYFHAEIGLVLLRASRICTDLGKSWVNLDKSHAYFDATYKDKA